MSLNTANIRKIQIRHAQAVVKIYERLIKISSARFTKYAVIEITELLNYFSKETLIQSVKNYSLFCNRYNIGKIFRYDSNTFFKSIDGKGIFTLYLHDTAINGDSLMAYECSTDFTPQGECGLCRDRTSYCRYCEFNKSRQNTVELANNSRSYEYAGTRREMAVHK